MYRNFKIYFKLLFKFELKCVWRETSDLFGCKYEKKSENLQQLCASSWTLGTILYDRTDIYFFVEEKVFIFNTRTESSDESNNINPLSDARFSDLTPETIKASEKWVGFDTNKGRFFAIKNELCNILDNKFNCWYSNGKQTQIEEEIGEPEVEAPDEPDGDNKDAGALINSEDNDGNYAKIKGNKVCYYVIEENKLYLISKCVSVADDDHNYSPNIIAAVRPKSWNYYYINNDGKYCKRQTKLKTEVSICVV